MNFQQQGGLFEAEEYYTLKSYLSKLSQSASIGIWEFDAVKDPATTEWASINIFELLGYTSYSSNFNFDYFLTQLVHDDDRHNVYHFFADIVRHQPSQRIEARLLTKAQGYRWFGMTGNAWWSETGELQQIIGILYNIDSKKRASITLSDNEQFLNATAELLEAGGWYTNLITGQVTWTKQIYNFLEVAPHFKPTTDSIKKFYHPDFEQDIHNAFKTAIDNRSALNIEACMVTAKGNSIWVQLKGYSIYNAEGVCIALKGSLQKLNPSSGLELLSINKQLTEQNKRLQNFAHIVSHNLRSYSNNLQSIIELVNKPNVSVKDRDEYFLYIQSISAGLTNTVNHLSEIVRQQDDAHKKKADLNFQETLDKITSALQNELNKAHAQIITDFSVPSINYLPAYMDSILLNLVTNAIKYRHPDRDLIIRCKTYEYNGHVYLSVEDNGLGIDLNKHGENIFGMYKTFHNHPDSRGLGLFMTRNQIETLGGSIEVASQLDIGTIFTIKLL